MTNTNVSATKSTETVFHESPSLLRLWWMNSNVRYDIAMNSFIIILNIAAIMYIKFNKIPLNEGVIAFLAFIAFFYFIFGLISCLVWISGIKDSSQCKDAYIIGRICHNLGFVIFLHLCYCISTRLALFVGLLFGLPCWLWYANAMFGPTLCKEMEAQRDWWKFVSQPQSVAVKFN
ncbi:unnamed protein product [Arabidopsis lyrata]|uniref:uncharacterized protein LOC9304879 n=1 Tax=Arabidopsis lyrata subsp. lyrata TaxID=81972 RepID=UPI000A29E7A6|nr:uncharacterized protein LOC9304879 [Arabidopsis lyrata subsp. lyrata]CAH8277360.1 unnamed protein product [Arabidopsis lyrata]|eukprot:XP_020875534.1 uncharacterized protein LOC9304879 [Arabidopsis lyrata subsp. lyrata]